MRVHGHCLKGKGSPEWIAWKHMIQRCYNSSTKHYERYGGRGITVCLNWLVSFKYFLKDMGHRPSSLHTLDRIKNNGNYEPDNCRWVIRKVQQNNRSTNTILEFNGTHKTIAQWSEYLNIKSQTLCSRLRLGWPIREVLTVPVRKRKARERKV